MNRINNFLNLDSPKFVTVQVLNSLLSSLNKQIILVPDFDKSGLQLIDRALELGYSVSLPNFGVGIKDVNDAVVKVGKLATLLTIMQARETSKIKIELRKKNLAKRIQR